MVYHMLFDVYLCLLLAPSPRAIKMYTLCLDKKMRPISGLDSLSALLHPIISTKCTECIKCTKCFHPSISRNGAMCVKCNSRICTDLTLLSQLALNPWQSSWGSSLIQAAHHPEELNCKRWISCLFCRCKILLWEQPSIWWNPDAISEDLLAMIEPQTWKQRGFEIKFMGVGDDEMDWPFALSILGFRG